MARVDTAAVPQPADDVERNMTVGLKAPAIALSTLTLAGVGAAAGAGQAFGPK
jgi:hypothetical protein